MKHVFTILAVFISSLMLNSCGNSLDSNNVYITPYGKRYHQEWCRTIQGHSITCISLDDAEMRGRTPCRVCY